MKAKPSTDDVEMLGSIKNTKADVWKVFTVKVGHKLCKSVFGDWVPDGSKKSGMHLLDRLTWLNNNITFS